MPEQITVVTPAHPARLINGMLDRAGRSIFSQTYHPAGWSVAVDLERQGAPRTRQRALEAVRTRWVAFLDSDDYFGPDHLQVLIDAAQEHHADYVYSWFHNDGGGDPFPNAHYTEPWDNAAPRQTTITTLVRTELAQQVGFWDPRDEETFPDGLRVGEDWLFTLGCMSAGAKIHHVVQRTWYWAMHGLNSSGRAGQGDAA